MTFVSGTGETVLDWTASELRSTMYVYDAPGTAVHVTSTTGAPDGSLSAVATTDAGVGDARPHGGLRSHWRSRPRSSP